MKHIETINRALTSFGEKVVSIIHEGNSIRATYVGKALGYDELKALEALIYPNSNPTGFNTLIPFGFYGEYSLTFHNVGLGL